MSQKMTKKPAISPAHPGAPRRAVPQARPQRAKGRCVLGLYGEALSNARTQLAGFCVILML